MKKIIGIILSLILLFTMSGCFDMEDVTSITLSSAPKNVYNLGEKIGDFKIIVSTEGQNPYEVNFTQENAKGISIVGFDTTTVGERTCTITYQSTSLQFAYSVVDGASSFAGGLGTQESPYLIENEAQLQLIDDAEYVSEYKYYRLTNNLVLTEINSASKEGAYELEVLNGELDGNGYSITINSGKKNTIHFVYTLKGTLKNVNFNITDLVTICGKAEGAKFVKVNAYGSILNTVVNNCSVYVWYNTGAVEFNECSNYVNIVGANPYSSVFLAFPYAANIKFVNCKNYGTLVGERVAVFFANDYTLANASRLKSFKSTVSITGCANYGELKGTVAASYFFAIDGCKSNDLDVIKSVTIAGGVTPTVLNLPDSSKYFSIDETNKAITLKNTTDQKVFINIIYGGYANYENDESKGTIGLYNNDDYELAAGESTSLALRLGSTVRIDNSKENWAYDRVNNVLTVKDSIWEGLKGIDANNTIIGSVSYKIFVYTADGTIIGYAELK